MKKGPHTKLTGVDQKLAKSLSKKLKAIAEILHANGLIAFSGGCNNMMVIYHEETGINVLQVSGKCVWMGGCANSSFTDDGIEWSQDISKTAGEFRKEDE
jgi:hypothetical protein